MKKIQKNKVSRLHLVICTLSLFAFIATAAVTTYTVSQVNSEVEGRTIASSDQIPKSWDTSGHLAVTSSLEAEVLANNYVQYTSTVSNQGTTGVYITHLSSYLSNSTSEGFIPLGDHNIEYTYTAGAEASWAELAIAAPSNNANAFSLANQLYLDPSDTVYLRYFVSPESTVTLMDNKLAFLLTDASGQIGYTETVASLDYAGTIARLNSATTSATLATSDDDEETYAEPLGVFSFTPSISATTGTVAQSGAISTAAVKNTIKLAIAVILALTFCVVVYLSFRRPKHHPKFH